MAITRAQAEQYLREISEDGEKVILYCKKHGILGSKPPASGCVDCWRIYYIKSWAKTPPHLREKSLDDLTYMLHHMAEAEDKGRFDFQPFAHPIIKIEKDKTN